MVQLRKLVDIAGEPLSGMEARLDHVIFNGVEPGLLAELKSMLQLKNGFLAFESALHVFSEDGTPSVPGLISWNSPNGWRKRFPLPKKPLLFFAQDLFACQFALSSEGVLRLNSETGELSSHSSTIEDWAGRNLIDYDYETGWSLAHDWQLENGPIGAAMRLLPKKPFTLGGEFEVDNLVAVPMVEAMERLGNLSKQIRHLPDGTKITVTGWI